MGWMQLFIGFAMVSGGETSVYPISSREKPVKKWIEIRKLRYTDREWKAI